VKTYRVLTEYHEGPFIAKYMVNVEDPTEKMYEVEWFDGFYQKAAPGRVKHGTCIQIPETGKTTVQNVFATARRWTEVVQ
jgi:hypothetical protein